MPYMQFLYTLSVQLYSIAIHIASLFNTKAKLWVNGRKNGISNLTTGLKKRKANQHLIWVHCASLGEFEQGRPLIEKIKKEQPYTFILLTFFSPSGYEVRKNYSQADYICYLPIDTPTNAKAFVDVVKPQAVFFVKYEFWFNFLKELKTQHIPTYLISGIFREEHYFFKPRGKWFCKHLTAFTHFFVQDTISENLLQRVGYTNTTVAGDTRFDRVAEIAENAKALDLVKLFCNNQHVLIAGSTWAQDINILSQFDYKAAAFKLIIAPHEIHESHIQWTIQQFSNLTIIKYSEANEQNVATADVLIIDNIGMLSSLYQYGYIAFIGGGFGKGIHNILEAATFGLPVVFGPNYHKFNEATELIKAGGAYSISSAEEFQKIVGSLSTNHSIAASIAKSYVSSRIGATNKIFDAVFKHSLF